MNLEELEKARQLTAEGELDLAWEIVDRILNQNPDHALALLIGSFIMEKANKLPVAWQMARRVTELEPNRFMGWNGFGRISDQLWLMDIAERAHKKAVKFSTKNAEKSLALMNLACLYINQGRFREGESLLKQSLMLNPESRKSHFNLGICQLAQRNWKDGWENYNYSLGSEYRKYIKYKDEATWDGQEGLTVALYGEQGLGDEISFASMVPDAIRDSSKVILDVDPRLKGLFQRSFPTAKVYGTRNDSHIIWDEEDTHIDASLSFGGLGGIYRKTEESFTGQPYLKTDPERVKMYRALLENKQKPRIGIAWTGGVSRSGNRFRQWSLEELMPLFTRVDAHWVCLQYKDASKEIDEFKKSHPDIDIVQYPYATLTKDYDDTAALVDALDIVVCVQTAVAHLCGAIGKECIVCVPKNSQWRYGESGDYIPWYRSVKVMRQQNLGEWESVINKVAENLSDRFRRETRQSA